MKCKQCGSENEADAKYCSVCGSKIEEESSSLLDDAPDGVFSEEGSMPTGDSEE